MNDAVRELVALCRAYTLVEREAVCCGTVSVAQCVALQELLDGPRDVAALADNAGTTPGAATRLVDGLERAGWVERARHPEDRRRVLVALTEDGRDEALRLQRATASTVDAVLRRIPKDRHAQVIESLGLLREALEGARGAGESCC